MEQTMATLEPFMAHIVKVNEVWIVRHGCELEAKPTSMKNQVVILSFGSSQFVSFVDSRNKTHDGNVDSNESQNFQKKTTQKCTTESIQAQKTRNFFERLLFICSHDILTNLAVFETRNDKQKKLMKKDCRNKIWLPMKSTSRNSAFSTSS